LRTGNFNVERAPHECRRPNSLTSVVRARRNIIFRARGHTHGLITRVINASNVDQITKPFVFLDPSATKDRWKHIEGGAERQ
jgi:hypothetical protein